MMSGPEPRMKRPEAAAYLGVSEHTLARWATKKTGPRFYKMGGKCWYKIADLEAYFEQQQRVER